MNERIVKLFMESVDTNYIPLPIEDHIPSWTKKFAELIVRECANRLRETDYELMFVEDGMCDPSISDAMLVAASDIEEHFGVE